MDVQQHHPQLVATAPPTQPAPVPPSDPPKPPATRKKPPAWWLKPEAIAVYALVLALVEMIAFGLLGWMWWLITHAALAVVLFATALAWRRKGNGGLPDKLLGGRGRQNSKGGLGARTGGKGVGRWPGLGGRKGAKATGSGDRMAALRGRLPRALGGTRLGRNAKGGLGGSSGGPGYGPSKRRGWGSVRKGRGGSSTGPARSVPRSDTGGGKPKRKRPEGELPGGKYNPLNWRSWTPGDTGYKRPESKPGDTTPASGGKEPSPKPAHQATGDGGTSTVGKPDQVSERPQPDQAPVNGRNNTRGNSMTNNSSGMQYSADQSLQRAGANLAGAEQAAAEIQRLYAQAEAAKAKFNEIFGRATDQMENDLPAAARLKAEMESTRLQAQRAASADEWRAVTAQAATLPVTYRREHEVDEERLAGGRGGRHKEKRADVSAAEQDN